MHVKKSAADIDALRWRDLFTACASGIFAKHGIAGSTDNHSRNTNTKLIMEEAAMAADLGMVLFYSRFEREK